MTNIQHLNSEQQLTITPTPSGFEIRYNMIYNTHTGALIEQHESLDAAMENVTQQYTEDYGYTFTVPFEIQENGTATAMIR